MSDPDFNWEEVEKVDNTADVIRLVLGILSSIKLLAAALGFHFFTEEVARALANLIPLLIIVWTTWKNNYVTKRGKAQKAVLEELDLTEK